VYLIGNVCHIPAAVLKRVWVGSSDAAVYTTCEPIGIDKRLWSDKIMTLYLGAF
jgi:hypothetical protein